MFKIDTFLNQFLPVDGSRVDAVFSISSDGPIIVAKAKAVIGFIIDVSGSMGGEKMVSAKNALRLSVDMLNDDQQFFIIKFENKATTIVELCYATTANKRRAHEAIQRLEANGGTTISTSIYAARQILSSVHGAVCQVYFLTDGQNDGGDQRSLEQELRQCSGMFQAHCRGVGTDWSPTQLRMIAEHLLGTVDIIAHPNKLKEDFETTLKAMTSKSISEVRLKFWTPKNARIAAFKQGFPVEIDLTSKLKPVTEREAEFILGSFGNESQDYTATFEVVPRDPGNEMLVCRPSLIYIDPASGSEVTVPGSNVTVKWTEDVNLSARIDAQVAHYTGQGEKAKAIQEGLEALNSGNVDQATIKLGRALKLAAESGDEGTVRRLKKVVDVVDEAAGTVKVRRNISKEEAMDLDCASTKTVRAVRVNK